MAWWIVGVLMVVMLAFSCSASENSVHLSEEEIAFIQAHPVIRLGIDPEFVPFEFLNENDQYTGITADYLDLIRERTGLQFEVVPGLTWPEAYNLALAGEIDVLPSVGRTDEREEHFLLSKPYYHFKRAIVTKDTDTDISGMDDLEGHMVAVQRNSSHHSYLLSYPGINLSLYDSVDAALTAVATGEEKAFVGNLATTTYLTRAHGLTNLRFIAFEAEKPQALYIAVRKDFPELLGIIDKALDSITENERQAINHRWIGLETVVDYGPILRIVYIVGSVIAAVLAVSFFWIVRLRKEIARRKTIQIALEQAKQEADEANQVKSSFLARMSHEIRTPLNAITGVAYLLKKTDITLTQKMYADRITQASSHMLGIINDILDYSKIEAGKVELETVSFSIDQVIQDVVSIVSYRIEAQEIGFRLAKDPLVPNWFFGDSKRIEQVLLNVLNNAAKFTAKGEVSLDVRLVAQEKDRCHLSFIVKDTGIGMNEEQVKQLFIPFTQGDSSINRRFGGSGLGLSIVKNLVDLMGGQIQAFSTVGVGSTFIINLSLDVDREKEDAYRKTLSGDYFKNIRTLVLEKTGANMNLIESYLGSFGMHCELTTSPASAMSMLEAANGKFTKPFDLFIIDHETPAEGGFAFVRAIRENKKIVKRPRFILLLPMLREDLFDQLDEEQIDLGIGKPIIPSVLFNGILDMYELKAVSGTQASESVKDGLVHIDKKYSVLVAEDNRTNQLIVKSLLEQAGIGAILAADGMEAVKLYRQYKDVIAVILMDLHMPVMNGYQAAEEIRNLSADVPIVAMTADVVLGVKEKCAQSGIYRYISKPFDPDRALAMVQELMVGYIGIMKEEPSILDRSAGLKNLGGVADVYERVLSEYYRENQDVQEELSLAIQEQRYDQAARIVHKIKGSSGSIGAATLYELSTRLQRALEDGNERQIPLLHKDFDSILGGLLREIAAGQE
ncbi:MAG TPA: transporter substrate-binding domain-containing protein [Firmicutes bacterium]|jgi:signal transduction histidine kinase/CheY-like chemotaxis protein|nr:transporter substrate-binding domain-containing protein [Bacillota bacterium]